MVGQMNNRVIIKSYTNSVDAGGGVTKVIDTMYTVWAKVENRTGSANYSEGQRSDNYDYKITIRAYNSKDVSTENVIGYGGKDLIINSVQVINEGKRDFLTLQCSKHGS